MGATLERARALAEELRSAGVPAVTDVRDALAVLPGVLVPPPRLDLRNYAGAVATWRLVALAADTGGTERAWEELDTLTDRVAALLPLELAEPGSYALGAGDSHPAYFLTFTETIPEE